MGYADIEDVLVRWVGSDLPGDALVAAYLDDAATLVRREFPDIDDRIDGTGVGVVTADEVRYVVVRMVIRALQNPTGATSTSRTTADQSEALTFARSTPNALALTDDDRAVLIGAGAQAARPRAFTVDPTPVADAGWIGGTVPSVWT